MSTRVDDEWTLGETWSEVITCTDESGQEFTPISANFQLRDLNGDVIIELTESSGIEIDGAVCAATIETFDQEDANLESKTYWRRLKVTHPDNAISRQVHGYIRVLPRD